MSAGRQGVAARMVRSICMPTYEVRIAVWGATHVPDPHRSLGTHPYTSLATLSEDRSYAWYRDRIATQAYRERDIQELIDRRSVIVGGPQRCIDSIAWFESQGVDMMLFLVQAGSIKHADIIDSLRRFGREVMPRFSR